MVVCTPFGVPPHPELEYGGRCGEEPLPRHSLGEDLRTVPPQDGEAALVLPRGEATQVIYFFPWRSLLLIVVFLQKNMEIMENRTMSPTYVRGVGNSGVYPP